MALFFMVFASVAMADPLRIAALGDSLTQGYGLMEQDGFVPQLQGWLNENGVEATVVNAGVSGDTTQGGLSRIEWTLTPDIGALIVALGGNDVLRGLDPAVSRANLRGILEVAQAREVPVLLIGMEAPGNYGPEYKQAFDAMYPELAQEFGAQHLESFFAGLMRDSDDPADLVQYMQPDGIHPNADGVSKIVEAVGPEVQALVDPLIN
nr:arylesterase [Cognatishimia sp. MH4019]